MKDHRRPPGDGVLTVFNDRYRAGPVDACRANGLEMRDEMAKLALKWNRSGRDIRFGVSIGRGLRNPGTVGTKTISVFDWSGGQSRLRLCDEAKNGQILADMNVVIAIGHKPKSSRPARSVSQGLQPADEGIQCAQGVSANR
jgi:class 3 adenylate cyclase